MSVFTYVQSAQAVTTAVTAFSTANVAGNLIVVVDAGFNVTLPTSVGDSQGNTYHQLVYADLSDASNNHISVWYATGIAAGTNTATLTGASTPSSQGMIVAEYTVPAAYLLGSVATPQQLNRTTSVISVPTLAVGSPTFPAEVMLIPIFSDLYGFHTWTLSTGTVRQSVSIPGGATVFLGDCDYTAPTGVAVTTASGSSGGWCGASMYLMTLSSAGGGGVILGDMAGGMRG